MYPQAESVRPRGVPQTESSHRRRWRWLGPILKILVEGPELVRHVSPEKRPLKRQEWERREAYARDLFRQRF